MLASLALFSSARALKSRAGFTVFCPTCLHCTSFASVGYFAYPFLIRAVSTTVKDSVALYSMTDYLTAAARAFWGYRLDCTLKAIANMRLARCSNLECLVIFIATGFTVCHR